MAITRKRVGLLLAVLISLATLVTLGLPAQAHHTGGVTGLTRSTTFTPGSSGLRIQVSNASLFREVPPRLWGMYIMHWHEAQTYTVTIPRSVSGVYIRPQARCGSTVVQTGTTRGPFRSGTAVSGNTYESAWIARSACYGQTNNIRYRITYTYNGSQYTSYSTLNF